MIVYVSLHAAERGWDRFELQPGKVRALAERVVAQGRRIGVSNKDSHLTWMRHKRAIALVEFGLTHAIVVSLMPAHWALLLDPRGGYYARRPDQRAA